MLRVKKTLAGRVKSFTLVELLVVIVIIGIVSTMVVVSFNQSRVRARDNKRISDANLIASALGQYYTGSLRSYPLPGVAGDSTKFSSAIISSGSPWFMTALNSYLAPVPSEPDAKYAYYYAYRNDGKKAAVIVLGLEGGTSKCNINATDALPDPVAEFIKTKAACYYVSI